MLHIKVVLGSTRQGRFGEQPARWILGEVKKNPNLTAELLDLRDLPLPFFDEPVSPSMIKEPYANPAVQKWTQKIAEADAFIFVLPEYNHGPSAVIKNAFDYVSKEWNKKAIGFVSWGTVGGARAIEQMRLVAIEAQMAPVRNAVHMVAPWMSLDEKGTMKPEALAQYQVASTGLIDQLVWWGTMLKEAREKGS